MKTWRVPVYWTMKSVMEVEADTLEDAIYKAQTDNGPLPTDGEYLDGSWDAGDEDVELVRECYNNNEPDEEEPDDTDS